MTDKTIDTTQSKIAYDLQDKVKIKVIWTPMNMQWELVLDFRNCMSIRVSRNTPNIPIATITVAGAAQDWDARTKINQIISVMKQQWFII